MRWTMKRGVLVVILALLVLGLGSGACKLAPRYDELVALFGSVGPRH